MILHNIKIIFRYFLRQKAYTVTSLFILAIGLASVLLIFLWVTNELGSDKFHPDLERLYLVTGKKNPDVEKWDYFAYHCASILKENYPEIEEYASIMPLYRPQLSSDENQWFYMNGIATQQGFLNILGFELKAGDAGTALMDNNSILLTEEAAERLFGDEDPLGKTVSVRHREVLLFQVSGIFENVPGNSSIQFDYLVPNESAQWTRMAAELVLISPGSDPDEVNEKIKFAARETTMFMGDEESIIRLFPFSEVYFNSDFYPFLHGEKKYPQILALIAIIILFTSVINYMSLATARIVKRAKDLGVNKVMGAAKRQLVYQFLVESFILTIIAATLAIVITVLFLPALNSLSNKSLLLDFSNLDMLTLFSAILLFTFIVSGLFPAILFTSYSPVNSIKGIFVTKKSIRYFRRGMVISLFSFSIILLVSTFFLIFQLNYMQSKNPGYNKDNIVKVNFINFFLMMTDREDYNGMIQYIDSEIGKNPNFICYDNGKFPTEVHQMDWKIPIDGTVDQLTLNTLSIGYKFAELFDINIRKGSFFSESLGARTSFGDSSLAYAVINNKAVEVFHLQDPIGTVIENLSWGNYQIIGVIDDFHYKHMSAPIEPLILVCLPYKWEPLMIKIREGTLPESMNQIETLFHEVNPGLPFEYEFFDQHLDMMYRKDQIIAKIVTCFAIISVIMSIVALIGFASFTIEQKSKEIGIRKIFGAKTFNIISLLAIDFSRWVLAAFIISCPIVYIVISNWLENFAYRIEIKWWIFLLVGFMSFAIALLSVIWQSLKAAKRSPVETLRYE